MSAPAWLSDLRSEYGALAIAPRTAPDPVNLPMIRRWCEAMGEKHPLYLDETAAAQGPDGTIVAPPAMLEVWTMGRFRPEGGGGDPATLLGIAALDAAGFTSVVATNMEQEYLRYLRVGDRITQTVYFEEVSDEKRTALGPGHFLQYRYEFSDQSGALVGRMRFRILKFRPQVLAPTTTSVADPTRPRPSVTADSAFFWEGLNAGRLLIRRCAVCARLHHPPGPRCPRCHSTAWSAQPLSGRGTVHSFVIVHQPQLPGFTYPLPVALVEMEEGVRLVGNVTAVDPEAMRIGLEVEAHFIDVASGYRLYAFRLRPGN